LLTSRLPAFLVSLARLSDPGAGNGGKSFLTKLPPGELGTRVTGKGRAAPLPRPVVEGEVGERDSAGRGPAEPRPDGELGAASAEAEEEGDVGTGPIKSSESDAAAPAPSSDAPDPAVLKRAPLLSNWLLDAC
jgi:hypothetical protein